MPRLRDACKRDIKYAQIGIESWESAAADLQQLTIGCAEWYQEGRRKKKQTVDREESASERKTTDYHTVAW